MPFQLLFTLEAKQNLDQIKKNQGLKKREKAVHKALGYLQTNPRHPSLNTHKFTSLRGPNDEDIFEAYAESKTPAAYRIFWHYGPKKGKITVVAITPHP